MTKIFVSKDGKTAPAHNCNQFKNKNYLSNISTIAGKN